MQRRFPYTSHRSHVSYKSYPPHHGKNKGACDAWHTTSAPLFSDSDYFTASTLINDSARSVSFWSVSSSSSRVWARSLAPSLSPISFA